MNNVEINNYTGIPGGFKLCLMGASEPNIEFKNNSDLFMAIYAPNADIIFKNNTNFRGSVVAKSVYMKNNSVFYYDKAPSEEEEELASIADTEFIADFPSPEYKTRFDKKVIPYPEKIPDFGFCIYHRYELP